jgi:hypothetical protein
MDSVYIVIENGESYPTAYKSFWRAALAVKHKHNKILLEELAECGGNPADMCSNVDVPENKSGTTYMYIEKGIHIDIIKLPVLV